MGVTLYKITHTRPLPPSLDDLTGKIISTLTPKIDDMITIKDCVIFGKKRSGKTVLEKSIAERIVQHYGEDKVNVYISDSFTDLVASLDKSTRKCPACGKWVLDKEKCSNCSKKLEIVGKKKPVHVMIVDDPLKRYLSRGGTTREQRDAIGDYEAIAHRLEDKLRTETGVGIIIIGSQQYMGLEKTFRSATVKIFKTTMEEDQKYIEKNILRLPISTKTLRKIDDDIFVHDKRESRNTSIVRVGVSDEGKCVFPPYQEDYTVDVTGCEGKYQLRYTPEKKIIADLVEEAKSSGILNAPESKIRSAVKGMMTHKPIDMWKYATAVYNRITFEKYAKKETSEAKPYADYRLKKDDRTFVWDYEEEKPRVSASLGDKSKKAEEKLRAYELVCVEGKSQKEAVKCMVKEGIVDKCTQSTVSRWCNEVQGKADNLRGHKFEAYVRERLKDETVQGLFDKCGIKAVYHTGQIQQDGKNYPDLLVAYDNEDIDVISCKCFTKQRPRIKVMTQQKNCDVSPELETFTKLKKGQEVVLPDKTVLKSNQNKAVRLVFLMNCMNEQSPCEIYKVYKKIEELPREINISKTSIAKGTFKKANWNKNRNKPPKKPDKKLNKPPIEHKTKIPPKRGIQPKKPKKKPKRKRKKIDPEVVKYYTGEAKKERLFSDK